MSTPLQCPHCGAIMNHHADKLVYGDMGEQIEEFHQCPMCGAAASRAAEEQLDL